MLQRLDRAKNLGWKGQVEATIELFVDCQQKRARNFRGYPRKHSHRVVNYEYFQGEGIYSIGSGGVESAIERIGRRVQISGARWNRDNVSRLLAYRRAYLNGLIGSPPPAI